MSDFSKEWLWLREPADARARPPQLASQLIMRAGKSWLQGERAVVDLGAGTGANLRYLAPRLGIGQHWRCLELDPGLLDRLPMITAEWASSRGYRFRRDGDRFRISGDGWDAAVSSEQRDIQADTSGIAPQGGGLVTASALLDLVSERWLRDLVIRTRDAGCQLLFALSYDGRARLLPEDSTDQQVIELVNRHQLRDKGFGSALGPNAPDAAAQIAERAGYRVSSMTSDWRIDAEQGALQQALIDGWVEAALEVSAEASTAIAGWRGRRMREIDLGTLIIEVGHRELLATTT